MKKLLYITLSAVLMLGMLTACGEPKQGAPETDPATPPDLVGEWKQTNSNADDAWQSATIKGDTIEVYWVSDGGDTKALYWAGTFDAPTTADEPYTWESVNDKEQTDMAILASGDDTKVFTYRDGVISYDVSAMGVTQTVNLEKTTSN